MIEREFKQIDVAPGIIGIQVPGYLPGPGRLPGWGRTLSFLVLGKETALLIDTGFGNADIKAYVEKITDLPIMVANTHIHPDHSCGNPLFDEVWVGEHEAEGEEGFIFPKEALIDGCCEEVETGGSYQFRFLSDGESIDLGNRKLKVIEIPGHTKGSIAFLDETSRILLAGDSILKRVFYGAGIPFSTYRAALRKVDAMDFDDIWCAHWYEPLGRDFIRTKIFPLLDDFDPERSEPAAWDVPDAPPLRMFAHGDNFEDPNFFAISFSMLQLDQILA